MNQLVISDGHTTFKRISKWSARQLFAQGDNVYIIGHKMRPGMPFSIGMVLYADKEHQERGFDTCVLDFEFYNANCHETGYYAAFYEATDNKK